MVSHHTFPNQFKHLTGQTKYDKLLSLSTIVFNSRDRYEIPYIPEFSHFQKQPCNRLYPKKAPGMHEHCCNDAVLCSV